MVRRRRKSEGPPRSPQPRQGQKANRSLRKRRIRLLRLKLNAASTILFAIYDGQIALGFVEQIDRDFTATDVDGREIGVFASLQAAADAISARHDKGSRLELLDGGVS
jgi:hypothetical protein